MEAINTYFPRYIIQNLTILYEKQFMIRFIYISQ